MSPELERETPAAEQTPFEKVIVRENVVLYDADAVQRLTVEINSFETTHVLQPLSDDRFVLFDKKCKTKIIDDGANITSERLEPSCDLWDELCTDIEGFDGEKPSDWKGLIEPSREKLPIINFLTVAVIVEPDGNESGGRSWITPNAVILEAYFNYPNYVSTSHYLRKSSPSDGKRYESLQKIPVAQNAKGLRGSVDVVLPTMIKLKGQIYDEMTEKPAEGYVGRIPIWHKAAVIDYIFRSAVSAKK